MAATTGPILAIGGITVFRQLIVQHKPIADSFKVIAATALATIVFSGLEKVSRQGATGVAYIALVTSLIAPIGGKSAIEDLSGFINSGVGK